MSFLSVQASCEATEKNLTRFGSAKKEKKISLHHLGKVVPKSQKCTLLQKANDVAARAMTDYA